MVLFTNIDDVAVEGSADGDQRSVDLIGRLGRHGVAVVMCSSKTRAQIEVFQQQLSVDSPFVSEFGSAAFVPTGYFGFEIGGARAVEGYQVCELGRPYTEIVETLRHVAHRHGIGIETLEEMSVEEVARDCGLTLLQARLAKFREYGECFKLTDCRASMQRRLFKTLESASLRCTAGDRYHHVTSAIDPHVAVARLYFLYKRAFGAVLSVGAAEAVAPFFARQVCPGPGGPHAGLRSVETWAAGLVDIVHKLRPTVAAQI